MKFQYLEMKTDKQEICQVLQRFKDVKEVFTGAIYQGVEVSLAHAMNWLALNHL